MSLMGILDRVADVPAFDKVIEPARKAVIGVLRPGAVKDFLHGTWLGHPLHPVLVQVPVGAFLSAAVLDLVPGGRKAATTLIAVGTASSAPAIAAGLLDWSQMTKDRRRVGLVHATANAIALGFYGASLAARMSGRKARGTALAYTGLSMASLGAYLGGHLAYAQGGGMNQAAPEVGRLPESWTAIAQLSELPEGKPTKREL